MHFSFVMSILNPPTILILDSIILIMPVATFVSPVSPEHRISRYCNVCNVRASQSTVLSDTPNVGNVRA
jgi:hypothetical protein